MYKANARGRLVHASFITRRCDRATTTTHLRQLAVPPSPSSGPLVLAISCDDNHHQGEKSGRKKCRTRSIVLLQNRRQVTFFYIEKLSPFLPKYFLQLMKVKSSRHCCQRSVSFDSTVVVTYATKVVGNSASQIDILSFVVNQETNISRTHAGKDIRQEIADFTPPAFLVRISVCLSVCLPVSLSLSACLCSSNPFFYAHLFLPSRLPAPHTSLDRRRRRGFAMAPWTGNPCRYPT